MPAFGEPVLVQGGNRVDATVAGSHPESGYLRLSVASGATPTSLDVLVTAEPVDDGGDAWQRQTRPLNVPVTAWNGGILLEYDVAVVLDGQAAGRAIQTEWDALSHMWRPPNAVKPPQLKIDGPLPHTDGTWVISNLTPVVDPQSGLPKRDGKGDLLVIAATIHLLEYSAADFVSKRGRAGNPLIGGASKYVAKPGETWGSVAKAVFKKTTRWQEIAKLNGRQHDHSTSQIVKHGGEVAVTLPAK